MKYLALSFFVVGTIKKTIAVTIQPLLSIYCVPGLVLIHLLPLVGTASVDSR